MEAQQQINPLTAIYEATLRLQRRIDTGLYKPTTRAQVRADLEFEIFMVEHGHKERE